MMVAKLSMAEAVVDDGGEVMATQCSDSVVVTMVVMDAVLVVWW